MRQTSTAHAVEEVVGFLSTSSTSRLSESLGIQILSAGTPAVVSEVVASSPSPPPPQQPLPLQPSLPHASLPPSPRPPLPPLPIEQASLSTAATSRDDGVLAVIAIAVAVLLGLIMVVGSLWMRRCKRRAKTTTHERERSQPTTIADTDEMEPPIDASVRSSPLSHDDADSSRDADVNVRMLLPALARAGSPAQIMPLPSGGYRPRLPSLQDAPTRKPPVLPPGLLKLKRHDQILPPLRKAPVLTLGGDVDEKQPRPRALRAPPGLSSEAQGRGRESAATEQIWQEFT